MESRIFGKKRAALIDMDGVLYDSMPGHTLAWKKMMAGLGVACTREEFYLYEGMTGRATIDLLMQRAFGHGVSAERAAELYAVKSRYFKEMGPAPLMPGANRMLAALKRGGLERVLVTGSGQKSLLEALDRDYPGMFGHDCRVTAHDVTHGKPDPEPYLRGAEKAGVSTEEAIVIENAPLGVRAGKAAGAFTIAVTTGPIPREEFEKEGADMIFGSMEEFADFLEHDLKIWEENLKLQTQESVIYTDCLAAIMPRILEQINPDRIFILTDTNIRSRVAELGDIPYNTRILTVEAGETNKSLESACRLWDELIEGGATRRSVIVNFGGGVVSDLGGFVAATFKRGIRCVNVPTTLLAAADAAIGGKTGIDYRGLKNEIGVFRQPEKVVIAPRLFSSLPRKEILSGLGEVVKMALLTSPELYRELCENDILSSRDLPGKGVRHAAEEKERIVREDPYDLGARKILNFGHTAGHAFEMLLAAKGAPVSHGEAVAHGIYVALMVSEAVAGLKEGTARTYREKILGRYYEPLPIGSEDIPALMDLMGHDKKNTMHGFPAFVLLEAIGSPTEPINVSPDLLKSILKKMENESNTFWIP